jgi:hypothetical protein
MAEPSDDFRSRLQDYKQALEDLLVDAQEAIERQAPEVLEKAAARGLAQRLDDLAGEARRRREDQEAAPPSPGGTSDRPTELPDEPSAPAGEPGTTT